MNIFLAILIPVTCAGIGSAIGIYLRKRNERIHTDMVTKEIEEMRPLAEGTIKGLEAIINLRHP